MQKTQTITIPASLWQWIKDHVEGEPIDYLTEEVMGDARESQQSILRAMRETEGNNGNVVIETRIDNTEVVSLAAARDELININRRLERELSEEEAT